METYHNLGFFSLSFFTQETALSPMILICLSRTLWGGHFLRFPNTSAGLLNPFFVVVVVVDF